MLRFISLCTKGGGILNPILNEQQGTIFLIPIQAGEGKKGIINIVKHLFDREALLNIIDQKMRLDLLLMLELC